MEKRWENVIYCSKNDKIGKKYNISKSTLKKITFFKFDVQTYIIEEYFFFKHYKFHGKNILPQG